MVAGSTVRYDLEWPNPGGRGLNLLVFEQVCFKRNRKKEKSKEWQIETTKVTIKRSKKIQAKEQQNRREREKLNDLFQISKFNVTLSQSDGKGGWNQLVKSVGLGFNEWSDIIKF